jgi:hypothetical protein
MSDRQTALMQSRKARDAHLARDGRRRRRFEQVQRVLARPARFNGRRTDRP